MLKNPTGVNRLFVRPNSLFSSPLPLVLILNDPAGRIARELWGMNQELSPLSIIPPCVSMLIY
jgi:hypothetical protein